MERVLQELKYCGICVEENVPLSHYSSFRIGGPGRCLVFPSTKEELVTALEILARNGIPFSVFGRGSNLVFPDEGLAGAVIFTTRMHRVTWDATSVRADAGVSLASLAVGARERALTGLEFAHGIPGTLGGAVFMNAGAFGGEMSNVCVRSTYLDFSTMTVHGLLGSEHAFAYRASVYQRHPAWILLEAELSLSSGDPAAIAAQMEEYRGRRRATQPLEYPSAGSVFKRPLEDAAGRLIDECSLKGTSVGGAMVSHKHAGFIVNTGNATCADVRALVELIRERVREQTGVNLECEIQFVEETKKC